MKRVAKQGPRQRIVDTAIRLFYSQGYQATGVNQIVEEAQVAKASFYHHFNSKEDLCLVYVTEAHSLWFAKLRAHADSQATPRQSLLGIFDFLERFMEKSGFRGCSLLNLIPEMPFEESRVRKEIMAQKDLFRAYLKELVLSLKGSAKKYASIDAAALTDSIYLIIEGALVESQNYADIWPIKAGKKTVAALIDMG